MVRVFYTQKTEQLNKKLEITQWRIRLKEKINQTHQELSDNWKMCALGERIMIEGKNLKNIDELTPQARLLGYDFSVAIQNGIMILLYQLLKRLKNYQLYGKINFKM
jgi:hypothetical protein